MSEAEAGPGALPAANETQPTPIWVSHRFQTALIVVAVALLVWAIWRVPAILTIVLSAAGLALLLSFPVRWLSRVMPRGLAVLVTMLLVLASIVLAFVILVPLVINQLTELIVAWPGIQRALDQTVNDVVQALRVRNLLPEDGGNQAAQFRQQLGAWGQEVVANVLGGLLGLASGTANFMIQLIAVLTISIYLLLDVGKLRDWFINLPPVRYRHDAAELWDTFGSSISRYLGGEVTVALITGIMSGVSLGLIGVPYALLLGLWVAFTSFIPIFGTYLGVVPALPLALAQSPTTAVLTIVAYVIIQQIQDNLLVPRVQGQAAGVHPIIIMLTVIWTGLAFGLFWSILAVPALVVTHVLVDFFSVRLRVRPDQVKDGP